MAATAVEGLVVGGERTLEHNTELKSVFISTEG